VLKVRHRWLPTAPGDGDIPAGNLATFLRTLEAGDIEPWREQVGFLANETLNHRFDLLGSGPVSVHYGLIPKGVEGYRYGDTQKQLTPSLTNYASRPYSTRLRGQLSNNYVPIDWHADFKSGFRWSGATWYQDIVYGDLPGVDVKAPWELARCQHLPWLAWAYALVPVRDDQIRDQLLREFQDQVLDFAASNPPQYGVNWCCTMDVAIRAANWLLTFDLFKSFGATLAPEFELEFKRTLVAHGRHIVNNLEWFPHLRSNHYLANVCGLLYVAAYLPACNETNAWLSIAASELIRECSLQFNPDGSNFEGSTSYHRLSGEMAIYSMALLKALGDARLKQAAANGLTGILYKGPGPNPAKFVAKPQILTSIPWRELGRCAAGIVRFARAVRRPDGVAAQFGDNDNGRFFRLLPTLRLEMDGLWCEELNNHDHLCAAAHALVGSIESPVLPDGVVVRSLVGSDGIAEESVYCDDRNSTPTRFEDFGLYVYRTSKVWLAVRCGSIGQRGNGGHAHNDQLALELALDGVSLIVDPGTYLYTPLPDRRNHFRSTAVHNTVVTDKEQNEWLPGQIGLFGMTRVAVTRVLECNRIQFLAEHSGFGSPCRRLIRCGADSIEIVDSFDGMFSLTFQFAPETCIEFESDQVFLTSRHGVQARFEFGSGVRELLDSHVSASYGQLEPAPAVRMSGLSKSVCWRGIMISRAGKI